MSNTGAIPVEVQRVDPAVTPYLLGRGGWRRAVPTFECREAIRQANRLAGGPCRIGGEVTHSGTRLYQIRVSGQPTAPSMANFDQTCHYFDGVLHGRVLITGSMKPLTIIAVAWLWVRTVAHQVEELIVAHRTVASWAMRGILLVDLHVIGYVSERLGRRG